MKKRKMKKGLRRFLLIMLILALLCGITVLVINVVMIRTTSAKILTIDEAASLDADCILVLGAGVRDDGTPSQMLRHRIDTCIML